MLTAVLMYGSYFALFLKFYIERWIDNKRKARAARSTKENGEQKPKGSTKPRKVTPDEEREDTVTRTPTTPRGRRPKKE